MDEPRGGPQESAGQPPSASSSDVASEPGSRISRKRFLEASGLALGGAAVGAGAALAGGAAASSTSSPRAISKLPSTWEREADVVVVGSGGAGLNAAIAARASGRSVLVLERASLIGGTTLKSGGEYWIPNNPVMRFMYSTISEPRS
jgi:3-oxosteroid 1-dehydrogenase